MKRRNFIRWIFVGAIGIVTMGFSIEPRPATDKTVKLTILHTNDTHSRIESFPMDGSRNQGLGGVAKRAELIRQIRGQNELVLLVDAGDFFQGTPYFNFFSGELEVKLMNEMGYDATTIGNHEFDLGMENLAGQLKKATFQVVNANYDLRETPLAGLVKPYAIIEKGPLKIGIFGLGVRMQGLVPEKFIGKTIYNDPVLTANKIAAQLKKNDKCDVVICLSHLGLEEEEDGGVSDKILASKSRNIDVIIGGHSHSFMNEPVRVRNLSDREVLISHAGWGGIMMGRIDLYFEPGKHWFWQDPGNSRND